MSLLCSPTAWGRTSHQPMLPIHFGGVCSHLTPVSPFPLLSIRSTAGWAGRAVLASRHQVVCPESEPVTPKHLSICRGGISQAGVSSAWTRWVQARRVGRGLPQLPCHCPGQQVWGLAGQRLAPGWCPPVPGCWSGAHSTAIPPEPQARLQGGLAPPPLLLGCL